ncbi:MAG: hypothetical protein IKS52_12060 [Clostridia bacterium]|nr:hypothetical protein [Clostridia bacterium]
MNDRIKVNSELLDRWASQLGEVSTALNDALSILNGMNMSSEWWNKVGNLSSLRLTLTGQDFSLGNFHGAVRGIGSAIKACQAETAKTGANVRKAGVTFEGAVSDLDRKIDGLSQGRSNSRWSDLFGPVNIREIPIVGPNGPVIPISPAKLKDILKKYFEDHRIIPIIAPTDNHMIERITAVIGPGGMLNRDGMLGYDEQSLRKAFDKLFKTGGTVENPDMYLVNYLHYPSDPSKWTKTMKDTYEKTRDSAKIYQNADGSTTYVIDDTYIFAASGGLASTLAFTKKFTEYSYTRDWTDENGAYHKRELGDKVNTIGYTGKESVIKQEKFDSDKNGYYKDGKRIAKTDTEKGSLETSRKRTIVEFGAEGSASKSLIHGEQKKQYKYGETEVSGDVGYGEAHWGVHGGLYRTEIKADGTSRRVFEPGVSADVGVSFGLAKGSAKGKLGNDYFDVHGEVEGSVLSGEAKAEGQLGMVDGKLAARAKASAEFNAVSVGGKVGVNVVGIEGNVGANVKVGVGAHADVGYYNGVVKVDVGASLGLGLDVNFELNVGGAIDNAVSGLKKVGASIGKSISKLKLW